MAFDGSDEAFRALKEAMDLAEKFSGSITVVHVRADESDNKSRAILSKADTTLKAVSYTHLTLPTICSV